MLFPIDDYHCCVLNSLCVCDYVCWCVSTCVLKVPHQCDCLARVYQWHHPIVFIQKETTISIVLLITKLWMKHACGAARCCVCVITLWWYIFFCLSVFFNVKPENQRALSWFPGECQRLVVSLYTRFSNLACAPRSLVGDSKFPFFPVFRERE